MGFLPRAGGFFAAAGRRATALGSTAVRPADTGHASETAVFTLALEPRFMFDAAGLATGAEAADQAADQTDSGDGGGDAGHDGGDGGSQGGETEGGHAADDPEMDQALADYSPPATDGGARTEIVFVDSSVEDYETLVAGIGDAAEVVVLDGGSDALTQIARYLQGRQDVDAIHIVSHGSVGALNFGSGSVDAENLSDYAGQLNAIGAALSETGDMLLYGCYVGSNGEGQAFLDALAGATGADVAASDDLTGAGGDWLLERTAGAIAASQVDEAMAASGFAGVLATPTAGTMDFGSSTVVLANTDDPSVDASVDAELNGFDMSGVTVGSNPLILALATSGNGAGSDQIGGASDAVLAWAGNGTNAVTSGTLTSDDGSEFSLSSFDFAFDSQAPASGVSLTVTITGLRDGSSVGTLSFLGNEETAYNLDFTSPTSGSFSDIDQIRISLSSDLFGGFSIDDMVIGPAVPANDSPTVTATGGSAAFSEDGGAISVDTSLSVSDTEGDTITGATVQVTTGYQSGADVLAVTDGSGITSSFDAGTGTLTLTGTTTVANYQAVLRTLTFNNTSQDPSTATRTLTYSVTDSGSGSAGTATRDVAVTASNDNPTVGSLDGDSVTFTEGDSATLIDQGGDATVADVDSTDFDGGSLTVSVVSGGSAAQDLLSLDTSGTVAFSGTTAGSNVSVGGTVVGTLANNVAAGNDLVVNLNGNATAARVQTLVRAVTYDNTNNDNPTPGARTVRVQLADGDGGTSTAADVTVNVSAVNTAPSVTASGGTTAFTEDGGAVTVDSGVSLNDPDNSTLASATVSITANFQSGADVLAFTNDNATSFGNIVASYNAGTGVLTLTSAGATATVAQFQNALRAVTYNNTSDTPTTGNRTLSFAANDGSAGSTASTQTVSVEAVNDVPVFANLDGTPSFTEGGSAVQLDGDVTLSDAELGNDFSGSQLVIARNGGANANDSFGFNTTGASFAVSGGNLQSLGQTFATFTNTGGTLTITFSNAGAVPTAALVNEVMQRIVYQNTSNDPPASAQLDWTFDDGNAGDAQGTGANPGTATGSTTVSITGVNNAPTLTATGDDPSYTEDAAASGLFSTVSASTVESGQSFASMTLTVTNVSDGASEILRFDGSDVALTDGNSVTTATNGLTVNVSVTGTTATVSFTGATLSNAQMQTLVGALAYRNTSGDPTTAGNRVVTITGITDSGGTSGGGQNSAAPNLVSTVSLTAVNDPPAIGNVAGETSQVTAGSGAQNVSELDDATVGNPDSADYDGGSLTISQGSGTTNGSWGLDGTNATSGGDGTIAAGETISIGGTAIGTVHATNDGQGGNTLQIDFNANATSARVQTFVRALTYSAPSNLGARTFTLTLNDADGTANGGDQDATANFTINVTPNPPVVGNLDGDTVSTPNGTAVSIDQGGNATVSDADSSNFNGGNMTITRNSGTGNFSLTGSGSTGVASGSSVGTADGTISASEIVFVDGVAIASVSATNDGQGTNNLILNFGSNATPARVQALIRALQFSSTTGGSNTFSLTITDAGSSAATSTAADFAVNVEAAPVNTVPGAQTATDGTALTLGGISVADADSGTVTTTVSVGAGEGTFTTSGAATVTGGGTNSIVVSGSLADVNATLANLRYTPAANVSGAQTITVLTSDGTNSDTDTIAVTVEDRPNIGNLDGNSQKTTPNTVVSLDAGGDATVTDGDSADFNSGNLTISRVNGTVSGNFSLDGVNATAGGDAVIANGETIVVGGTTIGTVGTDGQGTNNLVISFNGNATPALVAQLLQNLRYTSATGGSQGFDVTLTDNDGNTSEAARSTIVFNTAPTITANTGIEATAGTPTVLTTDMLDATDAEGDAIVYNVISLPAGTRIRVAGAEVGVGQSFTREDVQNRRVEIVVVSGTAAGTTSLVLQPGDGTTPGTATTVALTIKAGTTPGEPTPEPEPETPPQDPVVFVPPPSSRTVTSPGGSGPPAGGPPPVPPDNQPRVSGGALNSLLNAGQGNNTPISRAFHESALNTGGTPVSQAFHNAANRGGSGLGGSGTFYGGGTVIGGTGSPSGSGDVGDDLDAILGGTGLGNGLGSGGFGAGGFGGGLGGGLGGGSAQADTTPDGTDVAAVGSDAVLGGDQLAALEGGAQRDGGAGQDGEPLMLGDEAAGAAADSTPRQPAGAVSFQRQMASAAFGFEREAARLAAALLANPQSRG